MQKWTRGIVTLAVLTAIGLACKETHTDTTSNPQGVSSSDQENTTLSKVMQKLDNKAELKQQYDALPEPQKQFVSNLAKQIVASWQSSRKANFAETTTPVPACTRTVNPAGTIVTPVPSAVGASLTQDQAQAPDGCPAGGGNGGGGAPANCPRVCVSCYASAFATAYASVYATAEAVACSAAACSLFAPNGNVAACYAQFCAFARSEAFAFAFGFAFSESWATACSG